MLDGVGPRMRRAAHAPEFSQRQLIAREFYRLGHRSQQAPADVENVKTAQSKEIAEFRRDDERPLAFSRQLHEFIIGFIKPMWVVRRWGPSADVAQFIREFLGNQRNDLDSRDALQ